jgi:hypothetical protein
MTMLATRTDLHTALAALTRHDTEHMTKPDDEMYQLICAWAAPIATLLGDAELGTRLQRAALTCHSCLKATTS